MKQYLGDGVYIRTAANIGGGCAFVLTTSDGIRDTNTIYLEGEVVRELLVYLSWYKGTSLQLPGSTT